MTQRKKKAERFRKVSVMVPPNIDRFLHGLPERTISAWIVQAIEMKMKSTGAK